MKILFRQKEGSRAARFLFAGEGGQGVQAIAEILAEAAFIEGKNVLYIPNFGVEQRGGVSLAFTTVDIHPVPYPKFEKADFLVILSNRSFERVKSHIGQNTKIFLGPAVEKGIETDLPSTSWNIVTLGKLNKAAKIVTEKSLIEAMDKRFGKQFKENPKLRELDLQALKQ